MRAGLAARFYRAANSDDTISETLIPLFESGYKDRLREWGPTGLVPVFVDGDIRIHDSLAIALYLAEKSPEQAWFPEETAARALARSLVCEMHSGFFKIRKWMPVDIRSTHQLRVSDAEAAGLESEIERVFSIFAAALANSGGPFLFGAYGLADIFYAPVVTRFSDLWSFSSRGPGSRNRRVHDASLESSGRPGLVRRSSNGSSCDRR